MFNEAGLRLTVDAAPAAICPGEARITQIITNLLTNAAKFTPPGGQVTLTTRADSATARLTVADTGPGIPPADLPHIFERFWRGLAAAAASMTRARRRHRRLPLQPVVTAAGPAIPVTIPGLWRRRGRARPGNAHHALPRTWVRAAAARGRLLNDLRARCRPGRLRGRHPTRSQQPGQRKRRQRHHLLLSVHRLPRFPQAGLPGPRLACGSGRGGSSAAVDGTIGPGRTGHTAVV